MLAIQHGVGVDIWSAAKKGELHQGRCATSSKRQSQRLLFGILVQVSGLCVGIGCCIMCTTESWQQMLGKIAVVKNMIAAGEEANVICYNELILDFIKEDDFHCATVWIEMMRSQGFQPTVNSNRFVF